MTSKIALALAMTVSIIPASAASAADPAQVDAGLPVATATDLAETAMPQPVSVYAAAAVSAESAPSDDSGWEVSFTPYLWMSGVTADIETSQGEDIDSDTSFVDILGDLKFAFMGAIDARRGRFVTVHDLIYLSVGTEADGHIGPIPIEVDADMKQFASTHLLGYRAIDQGPMFLDLMAGARIVGISVDLQVAGPFQTYDRDSSKTQVSPVVAARFRAPLGERWGLGIYGDVGGFGVTADVTWQLLGTIQYDISEHWRMSAGWRHFAARQDKNDMDIDLALSGPIMGFSYRF